VINLSLSLQVYEIFIFNLIFFFIQYAHKLAYLVGQSLHKEPSQELSDRLFFL